MRTPRAGLGPLRLSSGSAGVVPPRRRARGAGRCFQKATSFLAQSSLIYTSDVPFPMEPAHPGGQKGSGGLLCRRQAGLVQKGLGREVAELR